MLGTTWTSSKDPGKCPQVYHACLWKTRARQQDYLLQSSRKSKCAQGLRATVWGGDRTPTPKLLHDLRAKNCLLARRRQSLISGCCSQVRWWLWLFFLLSLKWGKMSTRGHARENRNRPANQSLSSWTKQDSRAHWQSKLKSSLATSKGAQIIRQILYDSAYVRASEQPISERERDKCRLWGAGSGAH